MGHFNVATVFFWLVKNYMYIKPNINIILSDIAMYC